MRRTSATHFSIYNVYDGCVPAAEDPKWCACRIASLGGRVPEERERAAVSREEHRDGGGVMGDPLAR